VAPGSTAGVPLIAQYAAGSWSAVSAPPPDVSEGDLSGVTCPSAGDCWAVGALDKAGRGSQTLIEQYADGLWSVVPSPNPPGGGGRLNGVSCTGADSCWAVGGTDEGSGLAGQPSFATQSLIEEYDGSRWGIVSSPSPSGSEWSQLTGVACVGATDCWSVGFSIPSSQGSQTLIEEDTARGWRAVSSPRPPSDAGSQLNSVTCVSTGQCFAVGGVTEMPQTGGAAPAFIEQT
jgi:hypothetical protein